MASLPPFSSVVPRHRARVRSPEFHHFPVLTRILPFLRYSPGPFSGTCSDSTLSPVLAQTFLWYLLGFYPFSGTRSDPSSVLARTLLRYSLGPFFGARLDPFSMLTWTLFGCSPGFYPFPNTRPDPSSLLARTLLRYSPGFYPSWYSPGPFSGTRPDPSSVLTQILPLSGTHPDTISSLVLARIRSPVCFVFSGTHPDMISSPASCSDFLEFSSTHPDLIPFPLVYSDIVSGSPDLFQHRVRFPLVFFGIVSRFL